MTDRSERNSRDALVAVISEAGAVFRGKECRCPFHDDKRASAGIFKSASGVWRFKCHSCGVSGDVFDMRARVRGVPLADVLPKGEGKPPTRAVTLCCGQTMTNPARNTWQTWLRSCLR